MREVMGEVSHKIDELVEASEKRSPICVGLDPNLGNIPEYIKARAYAQYGETLEGAAEAVLEYNKGLIDAVCDLVPVVKPQLAMYEQFGVPGLSCYERTVAYAHKHGLLVIADAKRGDIGSTSEAYARAHVGSVTVGNNEIRPFAADFVTVNPYLGSDGVMPFVEECKRHGTGIFVLVKTSNPSSGELQDRVIDSRPLYELVAEYVREWGAEVMGESGYSSVGAVVGATYPRQGEQLRELMPQTLILVPGYGAQGATGVDLAGFFKPDGTGAIVNSSRGIIAAWKKGPYACPEEQYADAARAATQAMAEDIRAAVAHVRSISFGFGEVTP